MVKTLLITVALAQKLAQMQHPDVLVSPASTEVLFGPLFILTKNVPRPDK